MIACAIMIVATAAYQEMPSFFITNDADEHVIDLSSAAKWAGGRQECIPFWIDPHSKVKNQARCKPKMDLKSHLASAIIGTQIVHPLCFHGQKWITGGTGSTAGSCSFEEKRGGGVLKGSKAPPQFLHGDALAASQTSIVVIFFHIPKTGGQSVLGTIGCKHSCSHFAAPSTDSFRTLEVRTADTYMATLSSLRDEPHLWVGKHFIEVHAAPLGFLGFVRTVRFFTLFFFFFRLNPQASSLELRFSFTR